MASEDQDVRVSLDASILGGGPVPTAAPGTGFIPPDLTPVTPFAGATFADQLFLDNPVHGGVPYPSMRFADRSVGLSTFASESFADELLQDHHEDRLQRDLFADHQNSHVPYPDSSRFADIGFDAAPIAPDPVPDPIDTGWGDDRFASRRTLTPADFAVDPGKTRFQEAWSRTRESLGEAFKEKDFAYALAFGGMQTASGFGKAVQPELSGDAYLADQVQSQEATSFLPLAFSAVGTVGTLAATKNPNAALAAQYISGAAGQVAENSIDTYMTGHTFAQERAGESLAVGRGGKEAVDEFVEALRTAATPAAKELAEVFQRLGQTGPVTATGVAGLAPFQTEFGTAFAATVAAEDKFLSASPFRAGLRQQFGTDASAISAQDFLGEAGIAAFTDDFPGMQANLGFAQAKAGRDVENPAWRRDKDFTDRYMRTAGLGQDAKDFLTWDGGQQQAYLEAKERLGEVGGGGAYVPGAGSEPQYLSRQDQAAAGRIADSAKTFTSAYEQHQRDEADVLQFTAKDDNDSTRLQIGLLRGGGAAAFRSALPGIDADLARSEGGITQDIAGLRALEKLSPGQHNEYETLINQDAARRDKMEVQAAGLSRAAFGADMDESAASYGLSLAAERGALSRGLYAGQSYAQLQGDEDRILGAERAQANAKRGFGANPINSPAERARLLGEATEIDTQAQTQQYGFKLAGYSQTLAGIEERQGVAAYGVAQAQITGGPEQVYQAQGAVVDAFTTKIRELTAEIGRGGLTVDDRIAKERELTGARGALDQATFRRNEARFDDNFRLTSTEAETAGVGLSRRIARQGNAGFNDGLATLTLDEKTEAQSHLDFDKRTYPGNTPLLANDAQRAAQAAERYQEVLDVRNPFHRTGAFTRKKEGDEAGLQEAMLTPYMDGPESNPLTRGNAVMGDLRTDMRGLDANRQKRLAAGDWRDEDETGYARERNTDRLGIAQLQHEQLTSMFGALPEGIVGAAGSGVMAGIVPTAAMSARYTTNPLFGSWGPGAAGPVSTMAAMTPGGAAGGFQAATGAGDIVAAINRQTDAIVRAVKGGGGGPSGYAAGGTGSKFNPARPPM